MTEIHPTAQIHPDVKLGEGCVIGAYCVIGPYVTLEKNVTCHSHVVIEGITHIGEAAQIHPFARVGGPPQDLKYKGEPSKLFVGPRTVIREGATLNTGTEGGGMETRVGADCLIMTGAHVGHDCLVGDKVILVNNATLAGHVEIGDGAVLGGLSAVHQFCRIGRGAMIGGMTGVENDIIPYGTVTGNRAILRGLNLIGLERSGADKSAINELRAAYKKIFVSPDDTRPIDEKINETATLYPDNEYVREVAAFLKEPSKRRFVTAETG